MGKVIWEANKELRDCLKREQTLRARLEALAGELESNAEKYSMRSAWAAAEGEVARKLRKILEGEDEIA